MRSTLLVLLFFFGLCPTLVSQATSTDLFIMPGSDFSRPGLYPRTNLNVGIGHTFTGIAKFRLGNEPTFAYTYENAGTHGFWHTQYGAHTSSVGIMKNLPLPKGFGTYFWVQAGITSFTGYPKVKNRLYNGDSLGVTYHIAPYQSIWIQETYNKIDTTPWYSSTNIGYVVSW